MGGPKYGGFASWISGWTNLLGQIAGVASGGFAGAQVMAQIIYLTSGTQINSSQIFGLYLIMLTIAGIVNTFAETLLTFLCYISVGWQIIGTLIIVIWMLCSASKLQSAEFVFTETYNLSGFNSISYVSLIGSLAAASIFTGYDTAAHVAEETTHSYNAAPFGMIGAVINALILGLLLIIGMNFCIQDISLLTGVTDDDGSGAGQAYTILWEQTVGKNATIFFLLITLVAIECSNCANLTSAARMIYAFARDNAIPFSSYFHYVDPKLYSPVRAIWLALVISFILALPGFANSSVLQALFSLTATGLYSSYIIPVFLRITVARNDFQPAEFNLG